MANKELANLLARAAAALETPADLRADEITELAHDLRAKESEIKHPETGAADKKLNDVGTHHLNVPHGPEGFLTAWKLFEGLKAQGASLEMADGTFVAPEVLNAVLSGPDGFGDWSATKFIIVLPVDDRLKEKAQEYNHAQRDIAEAAAALEEAHQKLNEAQAKFAQVRGSAPVQPDLMNFSEGMSQARPAMVRPPVQVQSRAFAPFPGELLRNPGFHAHMPMRAKPWTRHGKVVQTSIYRTGTSANVADMARNTMPAADMYRALKELNRLPAEFGLTPLEAQAFILAYESNCQATVTDIAGTEADINLDHRWIMVPGHNGIWFDDYVKYRLAPKDETNDLTPERAEQLMASYQNLQQETQGYGPATVDVYKKIKGEEGWTRVEPEMLRHWVFVELLVAKGYEEPTPWPAEFNILRVAVIAALNANVKVRVLTALRIGLTDEPLSKGAYDGENTLDAYLEIDENFGGPFALPGSVAEVLCDPDLRQAIMTEWRVVLASQLPSYGQGITQFGKSPTEKAGSDAAAQADAELNTLLDAVDNDARRMMANHVATIADLPVLKETMPLHEGVPQEWGNNRRTDEQQAALSQTSILDIYHDIERLEPETLNRAYGMNPTEIEAVKLAYPGRVAVVVTGLGAMVTDILLDDEAGECKLDQYLFWTKAG